MKEKYKCLYEVTGNIEDVATFLVPLKDLKTFQPLTDEQIDALYDKHIADCWDSIEDQMGDPVRIMSRAIEAAHGIKGEA